VQSKSLDYDDLLVFKRMIFRLRGQFIGFVFGLIVGAPAFTAGTLFSAAAIESAAVHTRTIEVIGKLRRLERQLTSASICDGYVLSTQDTLNVLDDEKYAGVFDKLRQSGAIQNLWTNQICLRRDAPARLDSYKKSSD
jgi:hypothetical protein